MKTRLLWFVSLGLLISVCAFATTRPISKPENDKTQMTATASIVQQPVTETTSLETVSNCVYTGTDAAVAKIFTERKAIQSLIDEIRSAKNAGVTPNRESYRRLRELLPSRPARSGGHLDQGGDDCANATVITAVPYLDFGTTAGYQDNYDIGALPDCGGSGTAPDVVYTFTPATTGFYHVSMCGSPYDSKLYVYANTCSGTILACDEDACGLSEPGSYASDIARITLTGGTPYYFIVDGWSAEFGDYTFFLEETVPPSTGDVCGDPILIPSLPYSVENVSNCSFSNDYTGSTCLSNNDAGPDVIYSFTLTTETTVEIILNAHLAASPNEPWVMPGILLSDHCPPDFSCIASASPWTVDGFTPVYLACNALQPGTYYIMIDNGTWFHPCMTYDLTVEACVACNITSQVGDIEEVTEPFPVPGTFSINDPNGGCNNDVPQFQTVTGGQTVHGKTFCYTDSITSTLLTDTDWYRLVVATPVTMTCTYNGESWLGVTVFQPPCPNVPFQNGIQTTPCGTRSFTTTCLDPGEYYVRVKRSGSLADDGLTYDYRVSFVTTPCAQPDGRCCYAGTCAMNTHAECESLEGYWFADLTCDVPCPDFPPNDHCEHAGVPSPLPATFTGDNRNATNDCFMEGDAQVWHVFTTTETQDILVDYCGTENFSSFSQYLYRSCPCDADRVEMNAVDWGYCSPQSFAGLWRALPAGTWYISVFTFIPNSYGPYTIHVNAVSSLPPENDNCATATPIVVPANDRVTVTGTTMNADSTCANGCDENGFTYNSYGHDVFYSITLTESRRIAMALGTSDMHLSIYQGLENCCTDPAFLCNDDDAHFLPLPAWDVAEQHPGNSGSYIASILDPGTYLIRVAKYGNQAGHYALTVYDNGPGHCIPPVADNVTIYRVDNMINIRWTTDEVNATRGTYRIYSNTSDMPVEDPSWTLIDDNIIPIVGADHLYYSTPVTGDAKRFYYVTGVCEDSPAR